LQNITNNLLDAFTDYNGVTMSLHPARNVPEKWRYLIKPLTPVLAKRGGRSTSKRQDAIAGK